MGYRFRRSIRIAPGLRVNFGKRGVSLSAGVRGASITVGSRGTYTNVGIPGTGLSYRERIDGGSEQRRTARAQQRLERENERLEKERARQAALSTIKLSLDKENGTLQIENAFAGPLSRQDLRLVWDQKRNTILEWLEQQAEEINGDVEILTKIHEDTPPPDSEPEYEIAPFNEQPPDQPKCPREEPKPELKILRPLGFFAKLFKSKRTAYEQEQRRLSDDHTKAMLAWEEQKKRKFDSYQAALERFTAAKKEWDDRKTEHETNEAKKKDEFPEHLRTDADVMNKTLEDALNSLSWPRETIASYQIMEKGRQVWLDVDLPEIEDLPQKVASVAANGKKLNIKEKPTKQLQLEYATHIHGIVFRLAGTIFATLPTADTATISAFSQRLDSSTGKVNDDYLLRGKCKDVRYSQVQAPPLQ